MIAAHGARVAADCAATFLVETPGLRLTLADGALPLLSDFSFEDRAAKGLRAAPTAKQPPRFFTALELAAGAPLLLLVGPRGCGKTVFARRPGLRVLALGEESVCGGWALPAGFRRHRLQPLLPAQREAWRARCGGLGALPGSPGLLSFAVASKAPQDDVVAGWIAENAPAQRDALLEAGFCAEREGAVHLPGAPAMLGRRFVFAHLAALHLAGDPARAAALFKADPARWARTLRLIGEAVAPALATPPCPPAAALLAAELSSQPSPSLARALREAIAADTLPLPMRVPAGAQLARHGDPRDLEELREVPGGVFLMGSRTHPNSTPPHEVTMAPFRIGRFPVTNRTYARFVAETGRAWRSPDGLRPERRNAPAADPAWHDARAYCDWLTARWRAEGRIARDAVARLPTAPEWEYAARGRSRTARGSSIPGAAIGGRCAAMRRKRG